MMILYSKRNRPFLLKRNLKICLRLTKTLAKFFFIDPQAQKDNEHSRIITETNLYSFNVGLLMGMRWKK